jgi:hypothetical protein
MADINCFWNDTFCKLYHVHVNEPQVKRLKEYMYHSICLKYENITHISTSMKPQVGCFREMFTKSDSNCLV